MTINYSRSKQVLLYFITNGKLGQKERAEKRKPAFNVKRRIIEMKKRLFETGRHRDETTGTPGGLSNARFSPRKLRPSGIGNVVFYSCISILPSFSFAISHRSSMFSDWK